MVSVVKTNARHPHTDFGLPGGSRGGIARAVQDVEAGYRSATAGLVAHAGGGQANATLLTGANNRVLTVATAADSVLLPPAKHGATVIATNVSANSMNVFPSTGDIINALAANAAYAVAAAKTVMFVCSLDGHWDTLLSA